MNFKKKKILVTGGLGYIGSHATVKLLEAGAEVIILDNLCNSKEGVIDGIDHITGKRPEFFRGDIRNRMLVRSIFESHEISSVLHFAGLKAVGDSVRKPIEYYENNVTGSLVLFEEMGTAKVKSIVFSSSATVYGNPNIVPIKEDCPLMPINPYGRSKLMVENILRDIYDSDQSWRIVALRYFNPVGAHTSGLIGESPNGMPNNLMPFVSKVAAKKLDMLSIYGNDYPTKDGTGIRDYIHVEDLAIGHLYALKAMESPIQFLALNLGTGHGYSVMQLIKMFEEVSEKKVDFKVVNRRPGDISVCYADPSLAKKVLGWTAKHDLSVMCRDAWNWEVKSAES